jgi:hypothetical protein
VDPPFQTILYFPGSGAAQSASSDDVGQTVPFETGHVFACFRNQLIKRSLDWFERHLGPVN